MPELRRVDTNNLSPVRGTYLEIEIAHTYYTHKSNLPPCYEPQETSTWLSIPGSVEKGHSRISTIRRFLGMSIHQGMLEPVALRHRLLASTIEP